MNKGTNTAPGRVRYFVAFMCFILNTLLYLHRVVIGVAIVAMVKHKHVGKNIQSNTSEPSCPLPTDSQNATVFRLEGDLDWSSDFQGYVLGASYLSCLVTQVPGGRWAETWGAKRTLFTGNILAAIFTFLTPMATWWNVYAVIAVQFFGGLAQGVLMPALFVLMANWFPRQERGFLSTLVMTGFAIGAPIAGVFTGWFCDVPWLGWQYAFYIAGIYGAIISLIFAFLVHETPQSHKKITPEELKYITDGQECDLSTVRPPIPWKKMLTSVPVYALFIGLFGQYWSVTYFLSVHPTYMGTILHFSMIKNGAASTIPLSLRSVGGIIASFLTKWITKNNYIGVDKLRKSLNFVGSLGTSICFLGAYFAECDHLTNVICFSLSLFSTGFAISGTLITSGDMSPRFSGSLMGMASTVASTAPFLIPITVGNLTKNQTIEEWHTVFFVSIAIVFSCGLIFIIFGSAKVQPWNDPETQVKNITPKDSNCENKESSVTRF